MKAMVLAAGEGTRLRPLTLALPKPMVPIANTPLLERTLRLLHGQGFTEIAVNLHHRPEVIRATLGDGSALGVNLHYSLEEKLLGTAGGVKRMEAFLDDTFLVLYGDNLYHADFASLIARHRETKALATIATFTAPDPSACGLVETDHSGRVTRFMEKPPPEEVFTDQANAGVYILEPEIFRYIPEDRAYDFGKNVFPKLLAAQPDAVHALPLDGYVQDTGTIPSYRQANWDILDGKVGPPEIPHAPGISIHQDARLYERNIIGANTVIEDGVILSRCIIWEDCRIEHCARVNGAILGRNVHVGMRASIGNGAVIGSGATILAGAFVPEGGRVNPGEEVH
jgi:NDP-sugar pyrophosphorylase family protein